MKIDYTSTVHTPRLRVAMGWCTWILEIRAWWRVYMYMCESPKGVGWNWVWENKGVKPRTATFQCGAEQPENFQPRPDLPGGFEGTFITVGG